MAANLHVAFLCLKGKPKYKIRPEFCVRQVYFTSKSWRQIWWRVNQSFKYTFFHHVWGKHYCEACAVFYHIDLGQNLFIFELFKPIILQFFTILQDKLHSFNIQDDWSTRFLSRTNYSIDHIIKRFHEKNSIMPGLFSQKKLLLCDLQGNNYGLLVKKITKFPKSPFRPAGRVFTFDKQQICSSICQVFEWTLIELPFTLQHNREFVMFRFYFPLLIKLFMVLLCVIRVDIYARHFEYAPACHV